MLHHRLMQLRHPLNQKLLWLLLIFILGFGLQSLLNYSFLQFSAKLDQDVANAEAKEVLGRSLSNRVDRMEKLFYQLIASNNPRHRLLIENRMRQEVVEIERILMILEKGGKFMHYIELNLPDKADLEVEMFYRATQLAENRVLRIDIEPKVQAILRETEKLRAQMDRLYTVMKQNDPDALILAIADNKRLLKQSMPLFVRLSENINRVLFEQFTYFDSLKQAVLVKKRQYLWLQNLLTVVVLLLGLAAFYWISLHIQKMALELEAEKDRALSATRSKSHFLANMSHEIRTPLNAIIGFIHLLLGKETDPEKQTYLKTIEQSGQSLVSIINEILDFSKIENNKLALEKIDFDPHDAFTKTAELFKAIAEEKNIIFSVQLDPNLPHSLHSDPLRLKQVVNNLLSNALKFTPQDRRVSLNIQYEDACLRVSVQDQGIGISPENRSKIFEAFSQAESSTTRKYGGTGLGLAICARLVNLLGGQLQCDSELGHGSRFYFSVPMAVGQPIAEKETLSEQVAFSGHLLLVEDNVTNQMLMKAILNKLNLTFDVACDGIKAVEAFKSQAYDLILMDENMPNMNGIEATRHIREQERITGAIRTPIVALTANAMKGDRERFLAAEMDEYLTKPLNLDDFKRILNLFLNVGLH